MEILIGIIFFILGYSLGLITRNICIIVRKINKKIKLAEEIIEKEKNREKFMKIYCLEEE